MNNSGEVQTATGAPLDLADPILKAMSISEKPLDHAFEQLGLIPFNPEMWDLWAD